MAETRPEVVLHLGGPARQGGQFQWDGTGCSTDCSWAGFLLRVRQKPLSPVKFLDGILPVSITQEVDQLMQQAFFLGTYPGLTAVLSNEIMMIKSFVGTHATRTA